MPRYYLDGQSKVLKLCHSSCNSCIETNNNCLTCASNYYKIDETNTCAILSEIQNYYLDITTLTFKSCEKKCNVATPR